MLQTKCLLACQVFAPKDTSLATIAKVAGRRWSIEECFKLALGQLGLTDYEVRSWTDWHRSMTLVLAAQVFLTRLRIQVEPMNEDSASLSPFGCGWLFGCVQSA